MPPPTQAFGAVPPPPPSPPAHKTEDVPLGKERVEIAGTRFTWPTPDRAITVAGHRLPLDLVAVAAIYAIGALWLAFSLVDALRVLPSALGGLFSANPFTYLFSVVVLWIVVIALYAVVGFGAVAYLLVRRDPVARGLAVVVTGVLLASAVLGDQRKSPVLIALIILAATSSAVLYFSPWVNRAFAESPRHRDRPAPVSVSLVLHLAWYSFLACLAVLMLIGVRFGTTLGFSWFLAMLSYAGAVFLARQGYLALRRGPSRGDRLRLAAAAGLMLIGAVLASGGFSAVLVLALALNLPLWLPPASRRWFGDAHPDLAAFLR